MQYFIVTNVLAASALAMLSVASARPAEAIADAGLAEVSIHARYSPNTPFPVTTTLKWTGLSKGVNVTLSGTVDEILSQYKTLDPDWKPAAPVKRDLEARQQAVDCCPVAAWDWPAGNYNDLLAASLAVNNLPVGTLGVNPETCFLAGCAGHSDTGVWACNQNTEAYLEIKVHQIATYAFDMAGYCFASCGQTFDGTGWNTIVHGQCYS